MADSMPGLTPEPSATFTEVEIPFLRFGDGPPRIEKETRWMIYNLWAYRKVCEKAGIDLSAMGREARKLKAQQESLAKRYGEKVAREKMAESMAEAGTSLLAGSELDDLQQMALIVWGALISEDSARNGGVVRLTVDEIARALTTPAEQLRVFTKALNALMLYLYGKNLSEEEIEQIGEEIAPAGSDAESDAGSDGAEVAGEEPRPTEPGPTARP